ncbi:MAG: class I SAM-dependent methyltransferase [Cyanobacteriota bacterium]
MITYEAPYGTTLNYHVRPQSVSLDQAYNTWVGTREPPYFGVAPDARVWALALAVADPSTCPILDLGAGTGRHALPLARRGHPVDAIELSAAFAEQLRRDAVAEDLPVRVLERDLFTTSGDLRSDYGLIVLSEVASDFRHVDQLRQFFELAVTALKPGGCLVFNIFLPVLGYTPAAAARQLGQQLYTTIFTYPELASALDELPLVLVSDHSVHDYEQQHLPEGAWPPTSWYAGWVSGLDVFDTSRNLSPIEMRWLVYRRL